MLPCSTHRRTLVCQVPSCAWTLCALAARERAEHAAAEGVLTDGLRQRGVPTDQARLPARITITCCEEATTRWLAHHEPHHTLRSHLDTVFAELTEATT